ncbi:Telomerase Cajal body protein 1, partial [Coemansia sp. RSA 2599]
MSRYVYTYFLDPATSLPETQCVARTSAEDIASDNCFRSVHWSPDGQSLAASNEDNALRIYDYQPAEGEQKQLEPRLTIAHGETLTAYRWYPYMSTSDPATCCIAEATRDQPIHIRDSNSGAVRASYAAYSAHETLMTAGAVAFSWDGAKILAGYAGHLAQFDVQRPGLPVDTGATTPSRRSKEGMKGVVSCIAPRNNDTRTMACASFSGHLSVRLQADIKAAELVWAFPEEYGGRRGIDHLAWSPDGGLLWA